MKKGKKIILITLMTIQVGCGSSEEEKKKLDANTVTLNPAPGTYNFKPWVIMSKKDDGMGSGVLYVKVPGATEFESASSCLSSPYPSDFSGVTQGNCVQITESGILTYYLENSSAKSEEKSVEYSVSLDQMDIELSSKAGSEEPPEVVKLEEVETFCRYQKFEEGSEMEVVIQATNVEKITDQRYAYIGFEIKNPIANMSFQVTNENNSIAAGIKYQPKIDDILSFFSYSSFQYTVSDTKIGGVELDPGSCTITTGELEIGRVTKGTIACTNLRHWLADPEDAETLLGKIVTFSGEWKCDSYR